MKHELSLFCFFIATLVINGVAHAQIPGSALNTASETKQIPAITDNSGTLSKPPAINGPLRISENPNYFSDRNGKIVYLIGSQTWNTLQDWGTDDSIRPIDFTLFVDMLVQHHHNFTLLWTTELPRFHNLPTTSSSPPDFFVSPFPWQRTGPGLASDGKLKFDLTKFNQSYFDRLGDRVGQLNDAGIYVGVYLFSGEWLNGFRCATDGYPFSRPNNINSIDDGGGTHSVTMNAPNEITGIQDAYVKKMIQTLNDKPNVLWIVSEEAPPKSMWWNNHLISLVRSYEARQFLQHPIGLAVLSDNNDSTIFNSDADWVAPAARISPIKAAGNGVPKNKVYVNDSDHSYWEMWKDSPLANRNYFWINFTQGHQLLFMDPYLIDYPRENRNHPSMPVHGVGSKPDPRWEEVRNTMGYIRDYADRMHLAHMMPNGRISSTGYALANTSSEDPEIFVYAPLGNKFTVDLSMLKPSRMLAVEWFNPVAGKKITQAAVPGGSASQVFVPPFSGDAVLYLESAKGVK